MTGALLTSLALSLGLTALLESGFFLAAGKRDKKDLLLLLLVNMITNPVVVLSYWITVLYTPLNPYIILVPLELSAVLAEGWHYKKYGRAFRRPYLFSFAANIFSYGIGAIISSLF